MKHPTQPRQERPAPDARQHSDVPAGGAAAPSQQGPSKRRSGLPRLAHDVSQLPVKDVAAFVVELARAHGVVYRRTQLEEFAEAITRLADDDGRLDATGKLLAALRKKAVINGPQLARLMTNHMNEQRDVARSSRRSSLGPPPEGECDC